MQTGPDFLIIGAAKSGTTILHRWLDMQDQVFMAPVKEPHYFCFDGLDPRSIGKHVDPAYARQMAFDRSQYDRLFDQARDGQAKGEASPGYLYFEQAAKAIHTANPRTKIICLLRDPAERAHSQYMHHVRDGFEHNGSLATALEQEASRVEEGYWWGYHYRSGGFYAEALRRYFELFDKSDIQVHLFDDLVRDPKAVLEATSRFLGVTCDCQPNFKKKANAASGLPQVPRFPWQANIAHRRPRIGRLMARAGLHPAGRICGKAAPQLDVAVRQTLLEVYSDDIRATSELIGRDLSSWME